MRARRMPCAAEAPEGGDGRSGDWLIENAGLRFVVRGAYAPLTRLEGAGGTLIDAARAGGEDALVEATPLLDGQAFQTLEISAWNEAGAAGLTLAGTLPDGEEGTLTLRLAADGEALELDPPVGLLVVPPPGGALVGGALESGGDDPAAVDAPLFAASGSVTDEGGWVGFGDADRVWVGAREELYAARWPDGLDVDGSSEGSWVEALDGEGALLARLPVEGGAFAGRVPLETRALVAAEPGYAAGAGALPGADLALALGEAGVLRLRVVDDQGQDLAATLFWDGEPWPLPPGGGEAPVGPGTAEAVLWAGPRCEALFLDALSVTGFTEIDAILPCPVAPTTLAWLGREAWPDREVRARAEDLLFAAAAEGVGYAVLAADDEVAPVAFDRHTSALLLAAPGTRADTDTLGRLLAWPWEPDARDPAHGALDWRDLSAASLLGAAANLSERLVVVEPAWVEAAGPPSSWPLAPRAIALDGLDGLWDYTPLLDAWVPLAATGPRTWIEELPAPASTVDVEAQIAAGRTTATNGPRARLTVDGQGPGGLVPWGRLHHVRLVVEAPSWMPLSHAALIGPGQTSLADWSLEGAEPTRLDVSLDLALPEGWVLAVAWGDEAVPPLLAEPAWAITSPVWVGRP